MVADDITVIEPATRKRIGVMKDFFADFVFHRHFSGIDKGSF